MTKVLALFNCRYYLKFGSIGQKAANCKLSICCISIMVSNKVVSKKWISEETSDEEDLFNHCKEMELVCYAITKVILDADNKWKGITGKNTSPSLSNRKYIMELVNIQVLDQIIEYLAKLVKSYYKLNPKLARLKKDNGLLESKHDHIFDKMCSSRFIMLQTIRGLITTILNTCLHREDSRKMIESCLSLVTTYNYLLGLSYKRFTTKFNIGSNTYPNTVSETKPFTLTKVVQILSKSRVEINCQRLINCLVKVYKPEDISDNDSTTSTAESLEIYHTLTKHITPPTSSGPRDLTDKRREAFIENKKAKMKHAQSLVEIKNEQNKMLSDIIGGQNSDSEVPYTSLLANEFTLENIFTNEDNVNSILQSEEMYIEILLDTVANMCPMLLGNSGVKKLKTGRLQASKKAAHKVTEYYQNILWGDVGSCLEHIVLWWSSCPLAIRSPNTCQNLREWLFSTFNVNNTPDLILSALRILADALGCHVTSSSWDRHFGATLTTNLKPTALKLYPGLSLYISESTESGANFALMLQELVTLNNQCEVTWEYILGAPIEDLPIVEQIPILHRLDHSIHTYRLWCLAETRRLANVWEMDDFFRIAHNDMQACMEQLINLRFADHTTTIESGKIGVHENVCAKMREKLVSEVKVNIQKLKEATEEITIVLASVCATTSLAHLTMIFPTNAEWRRVTRPQPSHSIYVHEFLDKMLLPVIKATQDVITLNMVLRIMCESWLHHIYVAKVKFSKEAALQLLADFNEVRNWLNDNILIATAARKQMLQNEVLRRCEGVGRLLLHAPGDLISMQDSTMQSAQHLRKDDNDNTEQLMPAEMYVPNQKQWLTLRAKKLKGPVGFTLCCIVLI
ncbi:LOW QUALITY PROTEIN: uncharacterized protein LOC115441649 [Manduca sexta]|uniref:LOW QUALITY PROTEIN: uncharacterized protein LOC115441649 n=1 Tax=Manduca sexta TaxID=7130 RepID=UPI00188E2D67|nr:LOW QUALITY PROTEIN: uncharacterized protein LOC115441649 [Manduca sexta]